MSTFYDTIHGLDWEALRESIQGKTEDDVLQALQTKNPNLEDFKALISPAAAPYLEQMAQKSFQLTQQRFGKTIQLYVPLYLSNACSNSCVYCGFNHKNDILRATLTDEQIMEEAEVIKSMGYEHLLLVTGEHKRVAGTDYLANSLDLLKPHFAQISMEVQPLDTCDYKLLVDKGLHAVYVYQETYREETYKNYHPAGKKSNYQYRLETPDRLGQAGIHKVGLGCLLGLEDWRTDSLLTAMHLQYLEKNYWQTKYSISFPRLRPHAGHFEPNVAISDKELLQLICAYRIFNQEVELSLSTRESAYYRDHAFPLGITAMSAGSKTDPGGYAHPNKELEQFQVSDDRTPEEIVAMLKSKNYEPVWKDWDPCYEVV
ncbi:2-iminoacetate synthase ThiH [Puteibacter caeruleilacunae]|nr:2-iminoacetate synthase ThiH [Puteibacter caeruleilacunae]